MTFEPTSQESAIINALAVAYPRAAVHPLNGDADRQWQAAARRLLESGAVKRHEQLALELNGETADVAVYELDNDIMRTIGGTPNPDLN